MAEGGEIDGVEGGDARRRAPDSLALDLARSRAGESAEGAAEAAAYLRRQNALVDLQLRHAEQEQRLALRGQRLKQASDVLKLGFQVFGGLALGAVALFVAAIVGSAVNDRSLVVEPFHTPPDFAARGLDGTVLATQLMDKLAAMEATSQSFRASSTYANSWSGDIKVEIPQTGVSIGELQRLLREQLGRQRKISGEVVRGLDGGLTLSVRSGGEPGASASGRAEELDGLLGKAAEAVYGATQPYQYSKWLEYHGRPAEALQVAERQTTAGSKAEQAWAWVQIDNLLMNAGRTREAEAAGRRALALAPKLTLALINMVSTESGLSHEEATLRFEQDVVKAAAGNAADDISPAARATLPYTNVLGLKYLEGDYRAVAAGWRETAGHPDFQGVIAYAPKLIADGLARNHDPSGARIVRLSLPDPNVDALTLDDIGFNGYDISPRFFEAIALGTMPAPQPSSAR